MILGEMGQGIEILKRIEWTREGKGKRERERTKEGIKENNI